MATILYTDGTSKEISPANGTDFSLKELQAIVEGYIESIPLKDSKLMVINEEGKLEGLPRNEQATKLAELPTVEERIAQMQALRESGVFVIDATMGEEDYIAGNVLVCKDEEFC